MSKNKEILKFCMENGYLIDSEMLNSFSIVEDTIYKNILLNLFSLNLESKLINKNIIGENINFLVKKQQNSPQKEIFLNFFKSIKVDIDKKEESCENINEKTQKNLKVLSAPTIIPKKIEVSDFVYHFRSRYNQLKSVLMERNLDNLRSIRKIDKNKGDFTLIVSIFDKKITKNGNIILTVEDLTGSTTIMVTNNKKEVFDKAREILFDEIVALNVTGNSEILFLSDIIYPETVLPEKKRLNIDESLAFISDVHVGSSMFYEKNFNKFINWLNGEEGDEEQREFAKKIKYLFIIGDTVDGVGVFPDQEKFLSLNNITLQYKALAELLSKIRKDVEIIISPGQHDAVWVGEPQSAIGEKWAPDIVALPNVTLVTNPAVIEIHNSFRVLMYHGASMHGIIEEIEDIRLNYGHKSPTRVVKEMLKRRHLSPMHGLCDYIPMEKQDMLTIDPIPDIVCTGDQHRTEISSHNNILLISSSCWQAKTPFEEKVGNEPDPCKVPIYNLKTREVKILDFSSDE